MLIPIHPGCGGIVGLNLDGLCPRCGKHPDKIFQFDDPSIPCARCRRDYTRGHYPACPAAEKRMRSGHCVLIQSIFDDAGEGPPTIAGFARLERASTRGQR